MTALDRLLDFLSPPLVETEAGRTSIRPVQTCGVTYGYAFVVEDDRGKPVASGAANPATFSPASWGLATS